MLEGTWLLCSVLLGSFLRRTCTNVCSFKYLLLLYFKSFYLLHCLAKTLPPSCWTVLAAWMWVLPLSTYRTRFINRRSVIVSGHSDNNPRWKVYMERGSYGGVTGHTPIMWLTICSPPQNPSHDLITMRRSNICSIHCAISGENEYFFAVGCGRLYCNEFFNFLIMQRMF